MFSFDTRLFSGAGKDKRFEASLGTELDSRSDQMEDDLFVSPRPVRDLLVANRGRRRRLLWFSTDIELELLLVISLNTGDDFFVSKENDELLLTCLARGFSFSITVLATL